MCGVRVCAAVARCACVVRTKRQVQHGHSAVRARAARVCARRCVRMRKRGACVVRAAMRAKSRREAAARTQNMNNMPAFTEEMRGARRKPGVRVHDPTKEMEKPKFEGLNVGAYTPTTMSTQALPLALPPFLPCLVFVCLFFFCFTSPINGEIGGR